MISSQTILCLFLCICWSQAFSSLKNPLKDSAGGQRLVRELSESFQEAFPKIDDLAKTEKHAEDFKTKCLEGLGCFYNGPPFYHPFLRPISLLPFDLDKMGTKFYLYTSRNERTILEPNKKSLARSPYNASLGLQMFIHGYQMQFTPNILTTIEDAVETIMKADRQNMILVDWSASNKKPYPQAVANGRVVGAQVAELVKFLQDAAGLDPRKVYIIGHSLGSHVSGWAGKRISNLGRITGLDPAGPYFQFGQPEIRLHHTDADFVDIIHTDMSDYYVNGLGIVQPIGDMDFFPNGGHKQPGCRETHINVDDEDIAINVGHNSKAYYDDSMDELCNHIRAVDYFLESASNRNCKFIGTRCSSYKNFMNGKCNKFEKAEMGFFAKKNPKIAPGKSFYLRTSDKLPYCLQK